MARARNDTIKEQSKGLAEERTSLLLLVNRNPSSEPENMLTNLRKPYLH